MNYLLDTCVVSDFFKKNTSIINRFKSLEPSQIHISAITLMEIEYGLHLNLDREKKLRPLWESLIKSIQVVPFSNKCAFESACLRADLKTRGQLIGPYDILIAGTAIAHSLVVVTSNLKEFTRVSKIAIEDWRSSGEN